MNRPLLFVFVLFVGCLLQDTGPRAEAQDALPCETTLQTSDDSSQPIANRSSQSAPITVVCFGDSITKRGYPAIVGKLLDVETINAGVGGHTSGEGLHRISADVLEKKPDVVVVFFGTNDIRVDNPRKYTPPGVYAANLEKIVAACKKQGAEVVICTLPPIKASAFFERHEKSVFDAAGGLAFLIQAQQRAAISVAKKHDLPMVDLQTLLFNDSRWMSKDGVHPSVEGSEIIAKHIAKAVAPLLLKPRSR